MPRALAIFAALCLLGALAYALWPDGSSRGGSGDDSSVASSAGSPGGAVASGTRAQVRPEARPDHQEGEKSAPAESAEVASATLEVSVARQGAPVAGAKVRAYRRGNRDPNMNKVAWALLGAAATGKDGRASFRAAPGRYVVVAESAGASRASKSVSLPAGDAVTRVALALGEPRVLNGRVQVKRTHEPVPLADITLVPDDGDADNVVEEMPPEERLTMRADEKGAFRFKGLSSGAYLVVASAPGFGKDEETVKLPHAEDVVLELAPAGVLEGYVLGSDGKPSVGAEVMVIGREEPVSVTSGSGGGFSVEVLPGTYKISARKGGEAGSLPAPVAVAARTTAKGLVVKMGKAATIQGDVVRKQGGTPVAGATVDVSPYLASGDSGRAVTDDSGHFVVNALAPGAYDVVTRAQGFSESLERGITVANGDQYTLHVELQGTASIEGTVTDGDNKPLQGAVVAATSPLGDTPDSSAKTDETGHYRIAGVGVGRVLVQAGRAESGYQSRTFLQLDDGDVGHADFSLPDTSSVEGRLVAKVGGPPRLQFQVRLYQVSKRQSHEAEVNDEDGTFHADVPPDDYRVVAFESSGAMRGPLASGSVKVEAGKTAHVELMVDDSTIQQGTSVLVLEPGGVPSPGAAVWAIRGGRPFRYFQADETGHATLSGIGTKGGDALTLQAWNGGRSGEAPYTPGGADVTIALKPAATIHGRVTGGAPVAGITVDVDPVQWHPGRNEGPLSFPGSEFAISDLGAEPVQVKVTTADGRKATTTVSLSPGVTSEVTVSLDASGPSPEGGG